MAATLHLLQTRLDARHAARWAGRRGLDPGDTGYLAHSLTRALFGAYGPQPFAARLHRGTLEIVGYTAHDRDTLASAAAITAEPEAAAAFTPDDLLVNPLPPALPEGLLLNFRLEAVPTRRNRKRGEIDAHQPKRTGIGGRDARRADYRAWLSERLTDPATGQAFAELVDMTLETFDLRPLVRRDRDRRTRHTTKPVATLAGRLRVIDGPGLIQRLGQGVGGHRAFGFGMLRIVPA